MQVKLAFTIKAHYQINIICFFNLFCCQSILLIICSTLSSILLQHTSQFVHHKHLLLVICSSNMSYTLLSQSSQSTCLYCWSSLLLIIGMLTIVMSSSSLVTSSICLLLKVSLSYCCRCHCQSCHAYISLNHSNHLWLAHQSLHMSKISVYHNQLVHCIIKSLVESSQSVLCS